MADKSPVEKPVDAAAGAPEAVSPVETLPTMKADLSGLQKQRLMALLGKQESLMGHQGAAPLPVT